MLKFLRNSHREFEPSRRFRGSIQRIDFDMEMGTSTAVVYLTNCLIYKSDLGEYEDFGKYSHDTEDNPEFIRFRIRVVLKKRWAEMDLFEGLDVLVFGDLADDAHDIRVKHMQIPVSSSHKNMVQMNFMVVEPDL